MNRDFIIISVIPFLDNCTLVNYFSINKEARKYDTDKLWQHRLKNNKFDRISLKRTIHLNKLLCKYEITLLVEEITCRRQWKIMKYVLHKNKLRKKFRKEYYKKNLDIERWLKFAINKEYRRISIC
jgi:hypothetical protein